jgi:RimJ/RimL family protein N-acetyltransferase
MTEIIISLKNKVQINLRHISLKDIQKRHEFFVNLSLAQTGMVHTVDEIEFHTHETEEKIKDFLYNKRGLWVIACDSHGNVIGEIDIIKKNLVRIRHNGLLTIGILPEFQNLGLGTLLMEYALVWAKEQGFLRVELSVFAGNTAAKKLYKKFAFIIEGIRKNYLHHADDIFEDDLMLAKYFFENNPNSDNQLKK